MAEKSKLTLWRERKGWSQERLADELGCSTIAVYRYEKGLRVPEAVLMERIFLATEGEVEPNDFYPLSRWRALLSKALEAARSVLRGDAA